MPATRQTALIIAVAGAVALIGQCRPVAAHPHVWINDVTTFLFKDRQLVGIHHRWQFDEIFSSFVIEQHDKNRDGKFDKAENASVQKEAFSNLLKYGYFTHLRIDDKKVPLEQVDDFQATTKKGIMIYEFTLATPKSVDLAKHHFAVGVFDPEYYVEVDLDENDPVHFSGLPDGACTFDIREDTKHPIYYGMVDPPVIYLNCATS
jgi:ABC-type uncharacterized transport system substrate-binding protein